MEQRAGCDNRLGSNAKYDICGICGGDHSQCRQVSEHYVFNGKMTYGKLAALTDKTVVFFTVCGV